MSEDEHEGTMVLRCVLHRLNPPATVKEAKTVLTKSLDSRYSSYISSTTNMAVVQKDTLKPILTPSLRAPLAML